MTAHARITRVAPLRAVDGGMLLVEGENLPYDPPPRVTIGDVEAHVSSASPRHLRVIVPAELDGGRMALKIDAISGGSVLVEIGAVLATGLHQVDNPACDREGNVYATFSGSRENRVPVTLFRVRRDGVREPIRVDIPNPTSLAIARDGSLYVSSRFEGSVYRVDPATQNVRVFATNLGSPFGLVFDRVGNLWVGDRSGTIHRVDLEGRADAIAEIPPSIAAFHLALGPDDKIYVTAPTLSPRNAVYRVAADGAVELVIGGLGRPQGIGFDSQGRLYVVEAAAGQAGIWRYDLHASGESDGALPPKAEHVLSGGAIVGLAFDPDGTLIVAGPDILWRLPGGAGL